MNDTPFLEDKLIILLVVGGVALVAALFIRRGRIEGEDAGLVERILFAGGIIVLAASLLYLIPKGCQVACSGMKDGERETNRELEEFGEKSPGCSKPRDKMQKFDK